MKKLFFLALAFALVNCSDDSSSATNPPTDVPQTDASGLPYYFDGFKIDPATGAVSDMAGNVVGQLQPDGSIVDLAGAVVNTADTTTLPVISDGGFVIYDNGTVTDAFGNVLGSLNADGSITVSDGSVVDLNGTVITPAPVNPVSSSAVIETPLSSESVVSSSSSSLPCDDCVEPIVSSSSLANETVSSSSVEEIVSGNITVTGNLTQTVKQNEAISKIVFSGMSAEPSRQSWNLYFLQNDVKYDANNKTLTIEGTVPEYFQTGSFSETWIIDGKAFTLNLTVTDKQGSSVVVSSSSVQQQVSSSSSVRSSSSSVKVSSSSVRSSSSSAGGSTSVDLEYVSGGASGSGWATRYWDCCKPSCSWTNNAGSGNEAKMCTVSGSLISDKNTTSICQGGSASTCTSQIPIVVNDNLAYAFAAVPASNGGQCGHCYALTFNGTGKYETKANHKAIKGKVLVVMASNVGTDVSQGQFDIMIPGGGVGIYNGCAGFGWGSMGAQYGGLLSDCESSVGYSGDLLTKRKECLISKCNSTFANDATAKEGCLFLANWMQAAGNPNHTYKEVVCPAALKAKY